MNATKLCFLLSHINPSLQIQESAEVIFFSFKFVLSAEPQTITFLCKAEVTSVQSENGWCYIGCSKCARKLQREHVSFTCVFCGVQNAMGVLRYRIEFCVTDQTSEAVFVAFDKEIAKLTNIQAADAGQILGTGVGAKVGTEFPPLFNEIVGKTFTFQLKLGDFNFTSKHQTFTVSRIIVEHERAPLLAFVNDGDDHGPDDSGDGGESLQLCLSIMLCLPFPFISFELLSYFCLYYLNSVFFEFQDYGCSLRHFFYYNTSPKHLIFFFAIQVSQNSIFSTNE